MSNRDPFRNLFLGSAIVAGFHMAATIVYTLAMMAFRYEDQIADPWHTWTFIRFGISAFWIIPLMASILLWVNYDRRIWYPIHTIISLVFIVWGVVHVGWMIVEWANCNDKTGPIPDHPHCINRYFPAETIPDFSFYLMFISVCVALACTGWWLYFNAQLKIAATAMLWAVSASEAFTSDKIGTKVGQEGYSPVAAMQVYHDTIGSHIGVSLLRANAAQNGVDPKEMPASTRKMHEVAGQQIYNALVRAANAAGQTGTGIHTFSEHIGTRLGNDIGRLLDAHTHHAIMATQARTSI